jgi:hypothetical protein
MRFAEIRIMMKNPCSPLTRLVDRCFLPVFVLLVASVLAGPVHAQATSSSDQVRIQMTELGLMRALLLLDESALESEDRIAEKLTEVDFRLVPAAHAVSGRMTPARVREIAEREDADMVLYAKTKARERKSLQDFRLFEGEATTQIWIATTGELIASKTQRMKGVRTSDEFEAARSANERAVDAAVDSAIKMSLDKAHKILAHEAVLVNVFSDSALLAIMEYIGKMDGVYHVRRKSFDRETNEALLEIIGAPHSETFWRAYLEKMPKTKVNFRLNPNDEIRNKYPSWFLPSGGQ